MIQEYLNNQFIRTTEDENFEKLKKSCGDVLKNISKDKEKILAYSLIAFDPDISPDNNEVTNIKSLIVDNWQTFLPNSKDTVVTIIRAVMLDALKSASKDTSNASLIWLACRNVFKHYKLGKEKEILTSFLSGLGNKVEDEVSETWSFSPDYEIEIPKITAAVIDENDFSAGFTPATVKDATNKALKKQISELRENQKKFADLVNLMQMRTQLLWWKEAGYSPLLKTSYKNMKPGQLEILLAYDYSNFIPDLYPSSVDYFLVETHKALSANADKKIKISEFLKLITDKELGLVNAVPEFNGAEGRILFANFVKGLIHGKYQISQFKSLVGVTDTTELSLSEIVLWLFNDLHCVALSQSK